MRKGLTKRIDHLTGKAIHDWDMISENDRILVGLSGGQDSQTLINRLTAFKKRAPIRFEIFPVHIDPGFKGSFSKDLKAYIDRVYDPVRIEATDFGIVAHSEENRENPCFLCSRLRRKRLFKIAKGLECRKLAFGHHKDDIIETLFVNIFYAGKIGTMKPKQPFFKGTLDIIRPLSYVERHEIKRFCQMKDLPVFGNNCPSSNMTKRIEVKQMLERMYKLNKHIKGNVFRAMSNIASEYLLDIDDDRHSKPTGLQKNSD